jgi:putative transposase
MKSRFTTEQIIRILKQAESGIPVKDLVREHGICEQTFYRWKSKYGGMQVNEARRLKELEAENRKLKQLLGDKELQILGLTEALRKNY